MAFQQSLRKKG